jgi:phage major head subunit gpT-like protein
MINTTANVAELSRGFSKVFEKSRKDTEVWHPKLSMKISSSHAVEIHSFMARMLAMREWVGPRLLDSIKNHEYVLRNRDFEKSLAVPVNDIEDDALGIYDLKFQELARIIAKHPDQLMKETLQAGTSTNGFDGVSFFSGSHPLDPAGVQSNNFTSTALNAANLNTVITAMYTYTGEDGELLGVLNGGQPVLVIPPQLLLTAKGIVNAEYTGGGNTNVQNGQAQIMVIPELANEATTWYVADLSGPIKPLIHQVRKEGQLVAKTSPSDENVFNDNQYVWGTHVRDAGGYGPWWLMARAIA